MENSPFCHSPQDIWHGTGIVDRNDRLAENTLRLSVKTDGVLPAVRPGQFAMFRLPNRQDPLLGRPLAIYQAERHRIEAVYLSVGKMTNRLADMKPNDPIEFWMPLGNGFPCRASAPSRLVEDRSSISNTLINNTLADKSPAGHESASLHTVIVAGGIGQTPFLMYCQNRRPQERISFLYGAKTRKKIVCMDDFRQCGITPHIATEDGTEGYEGFVTDLIEQVYTPGESAQFQLLCCGPMPMLRSAFQVAKRLTLPCLVSLETPMSCGLGICFGCVVLHRKEEADVWDYRRTCTDGPVFDAYKLHWG